MTDKDGKDEFFEIINAQEFEFDDPEALVLDTEVISSGEVSFSELQEGDRLVIRQESEGIEMESTLFVVGMEEVPHLGSIPSSEQIPIVLDPDAGFCAKILLGASDKADPELSDLDRTIAAGRTLVIGFSEGQTGAYDPRVNYRLAPSIRFITDVMLLRKRAPLGKESPKDSPEED